jgi:hypothetical protein
MGSRNRTSARRAAPPARETWLRKIGAKLAPGPAKVWPYTLAVVLLPLIVLWHRDNALYPPPWYGDSWFYLGFFRNLVEFKRSLFFNFYYGSRLSWVLPGYLIHSLFSVVAANCVLHLTVHIVATLSFFSTLRLTAGVRRAYLATMVFSVQPWLWAATGWDYPDGAGIAYCLLAMALLTRSALRPVGKWSLLGAGMALAAMVYAHLFWASLAPLLLLYYIGSAWGWRRTPPIHAAARLLLWAGAGFGVVTAAFGGINYLLDGNILFYAPSIAQARTMASNFMYFRPVWAEHQLVPWLWPAVAGSIAALLLLPSRARRELAGRNAAALLFSAQLLLAFAYMACLQSRGAAVLGHHPYVSYLLPFSFLAMGISFWPAVESMSLRAYVMVCSAAAAIFAAVWFEPLGLLSPVSPVAQQAWLAFCAGTLPLALLWRRRLAGTLLAIAGFAAFCSLSLAQTSNLYWVDLHGDREQYRRVMDARQRIEERRGDSPILFWYDRQEPAYFEYCALDATYLSEFSRISEHFPSGCPERSAKGSLVVVSSWRGGAAEIARSALDRCLSSSGLKAVLGDSFAGSQGPHPYTISLLRTEIDYSVLRPLTVTFGLSGKGVLQLAPNPTGDEPLPLNRWNSSPGASQSVTSEGIEVQTPGGHSDYAFTYPALEAPATGQYRFVLRYSPRSGQFAFGGFPADESRWLASDQSRHNWGKHGEELAFSLNLKQGDSVILRIANSNSQDRPSSFTIEDVLVYLLAPAKCP